MKGYTFDIRRAIICYQYSERIKSELIIAGKLLGELGGLEGGELSGAEKLMSSFLDALIGEIEIAHSVTKLRNFREASLKLSEAAGRISLHNYLKANRCLSEAISLVTGCGGKAFQLLKEKRFL